MMRFLWLLAAVLPCSTAAAHITLDEPTSRYVDAGDNKACPCGAGTSNRLCEVPSERSDPNRNEARATQYLPGETITVRFRETVAHSGRFRIAFDEDGADLADFNANILLDVADPAGNSGNQGGNTWAFQVTLPSVECNNCTLQLIQMMNGNTTDPVLDPVGLSSYYQCADLTLAVGTADGGTDDGGVSDGGVSDGGPADGGWLDGDGDLVTHSSGGTSGGCSCSGSHAGAATGFALLSLLVVAGGLSRRARRRRRQR